MDETQHFCLRWNNYQSSITSAFENLRDDEDFVDVTLACEGRSIKAHRVVLSACSPYFRDLLKSTPCKHPVILLQDVNFHDLHSLVEFIYHGEVNVHQKSLQSFLKTAEVLRVSGLTQQQAEETNSQLLQIQNLANSGVRTPLNSYHSAMHADDSPLYPHSMGSPPPPPFPPSQIPLHKRNIAMIRREQHNNSSSSAEDPNHVLKRMRASSDNGLPPSSNTKSPDIIHPRSTSPQLTPTDFSTIKHNNNNSPPPKDEKRNGSNSATNIGGAGVGGGGNGNGTSSNTNGNGISSSEKLGSLTPSPLTRSAEDVKSEPMELVCPNNNTDEHSNDSTGEHNVHHRANSADCGKGSMSSVNDEEIENTMPPHPPTAPFSFSPGEKLFPSTPFPPFSMGNLDPAAFANLNPQLQSAAELAASPQGGSTNLLGGVIVPGVNPNTSSNHHHLHHHHSTHALHQHEHQMHSHQHQQQSQQQQQQQERKERNSEHRESDTDNERERERERERDRERERHGQRATPDQKSHQMQHQHQQQQQQQQGPHNSMRSATSSPTSSTSAPPSPPTALTSPNSSLGSMMCNSNNNNNNNSNLNNGAGSYNMHNSPPRPGSGGGGIAGLASSNNNSPQMPLRMPPPTSGGINEPQECPYCRRTFSCYYSLKRHFQDKHEQSDTLYVCEFCNRRYRTKNSLTTHKSLQHRGSSGMLKRLLKTSMKNVLVPPHHHHHHHHHAMAHQRTALFDFSSELGQPPPGIQ